MARFLSFDNRRRSIRSISIINEKEGIIPALESSHAVAYALKLAPKMKEDEGLVICLSGRGDKDVESIKRYMEEV